MPRLQQLFARGLAAGERRSRGSLPRETGTLWAGGRIKSYPLIVKQQLVVLLTSLLPYVAVYAVVWGEQAPAGDSQRLTGWLVWTVVASLYVTSVALLLDDDRERREERRRRKVPGWWSSTK